MQAISHGRRFARAALAATRAEAAEGGETAAFWRGILDRWHLARREGPTAGRPPRWSGSEIHALQLGPASTAGRLEPRSRRPMRLCSRHSTPSFRPRAAGHAAGGRNCTAGSRRRSIRASGCSGFGGHIASAARAAAASLWTTRWVWKARASRPGRKASMPTPRIPTAARRRSASSGISPARRSRRQLSGTRACRSVKRCRSLSARMSSRRRLRRTVFC